MEADVEFLVVLVFSDRKKWAYVVAKLALETFKSEYYRIVVNLLLRE